MPHYITIIVIIIVVQFKDFVKVYTTEYHPVTIFRPSCP